MCITPISVGFCGLVKSTKKPFYNRSEFLEIYATRCNSSLQITTKIWLLWLTYLLLWDLQGRIFSSFAFNLYDWLSFLSGSVLNNEQQVYIIGHISLKVQCTQMPQNHLRLNSAHAQCSLRNYNAPLFPDPLRLFKVEGSEGIERGRSGRGMREREEGKGSK